MKGFIRKDLLFSLCGLNCALCPMKLGKYCPGCGGGEGNQGCSIAKCSMQNQEIEYCFQCSKYPCVKYHDIDKYDSFITHRNQISDMDRMQEIGLEEYHAQLIEKQDILNYLLDNYNDGRKKNFFCIAINLLNIEDVRTIVEILISQTQSSELTIKEKSAIATTLFQKTAKEKNIVLKYNKK